MPPTRAFIVHPEIKVSRKDRDALASRVLVSRDQDSALAEIYGLAEAINLNVIDHVTPPVSRIQAGSFLGKGQRAEIGTAVKAHDCELVIFNHTLSPVQQRNLEKEWSAKVLDRTALILEIFGARANTKEGRLQVELAAMEYQRSRLVRSWTHLERQRGGAGFMGGPGERQIEIDRRLIGERITNLKRELEDVRRTRDLSRKSRERVPFPTIALVGYTNAGKSTLFNKLTEAKVLAKDMLFATLDPTMRRVELPNGQKVIFSDTVGFIADLPTDLIAAFRATLEQTNYADVIAHVMDASNPDWRAQRQDVIEILHDMGIDYEDDPRILEIYNKADLVPPDDLADIQRSVKFNDNQCLVSAVSGQGLDNLLQKVTAIVSRNRVEVGIDLPVTDGKALSWLYEHAKVVQRQDKDDRIYLEMSIEPAHLDQFVSRYGYVPK